MRKVLVAFAFLMMLLVPTIPTSKSYEPQANQVSHEILLAIEQCITTDTCSHRRRSVTISNKDYLSVRIITQDNIIIDYLASDETFLVVVTASRHNMIIIEDTGYTGYVGVVRWMVTSFTDEPDKKMSPEEERVALASAQNLYKETMALAANVLLFRSGAFQV